jgi:hypothetical protein
MQLILKHLSILFIIGHRHTRVIEVSSVISREMVGRSGDTPSRLSRTAIVLRGTACCRVWWRLRACRPCRSRSHRSPSSALAATQLRDALPGMGYAPTNPVPFPSISRVSAPDSQSLQIICQETTPHKNMLR